MQRAHPVGRSFRLPGESVGIGARWREAGGEISAPAEAPVERLRDRLGGTGCRPADRQAAAEPLGGGSEPKTWARTGKNQRTHPSSILKIICSLDKHTKHTISIFLTIMITLRTNWFIIYSLKCQNFAKSVHFSRGFQKLYIRLINAATSPPEVNFVYFCSHKINCTSSIMCHMQHKQLCYHWLHSKSCSSASKWSYHPAWEWQSFSGRVPNPAESQRGKSRTPQSQTSPESLHPA